MKFELNKNTLARALSALGKLVSRTSPIDAYRCIEVRSHENRLHFRTLSMEESLVFSMDAETGEDFTSVICFEQFRTAVSNCKNKSLVFEVRKNLFCIDGSEIKTTVCTFPETTAVPDDVKAEALPDTFIQILNAAAPLVNRNDYRRALRGINLSSDGITATNGKELFNAPLKLNVESLTLPFPLALITSKAAGTGSLYYWTDGVSVFFRISIGSWTWSGKALADSYPNWKRIIPDRKDLTHSVTFTFERAEQMRIFLKSMPDDPPDNKIELSRHEGSLHLQNRKGADFGIEADFRGNWNGFTLPVNREILLRLLNEGHTHIECQDKHGPFLATGGIGQYIAMPLYQPHSESEETQQNEEKTKMENTEHVVSVPVQTVAPKQEPETALNPLDDLSASIEAFKLKMKASFDEVSSLARKVKEAQLAQKQKERDFIQARRAIERIRMVSGF